MNAPAARTPVGLAFFAATVVVSLVGCHEGDDRYFADVASVSDVGDAAVEPADIEPADVPAVDVEGPDVLDVAEVEPDVGTDVVEPWKPAIYKYPSCDPATPSGLTGCVDMGRLTATLTSVVGSRYPGDTKWAEVRGLCKTLLTENGFTVTENPGPIAGGGNVIGVKLGSDPALTSQRVIVGAHIDGRRNCDAANGNGTGVTALFELIRLLGPREHRRTLVAACWDGDELQRAGAIEMADDAMVAGDDIRVAFDLNAIGFTDATPDVQETPLTILQFQDARAGLKARAYRGTTLWLLGGADAAGPMGRLEAHAAAIGLPVTPLHFKLNWLKSNTFSDFRRSSHAAFWDRGIPAIQVTDTGRSRNPQHECRQGGADTLERIDWNFFRAATATTIAAVAETLDADDAGTTPNPYQPACDVTRQDCPVGERCVYLRDADGFEIRACIPVAPEPRSEGAVCTRPNDLLGEDDCDKGLGCSFYGGRWANADPAAPEYERVCSRYCRFRKDCGDGEQCFVLGSSAIERTGICRPACAPLSAGNCPEGQKCSANSLTVGFLQVPLCTPAGPVELGAACLDTNACARDLQCVPSSNTGSFSCLPYCSDTLPCPNELVCFGSFGLIAPDPTFGFCAAALE